MAGVGHVEELRIPARDFWVNAKSGVLGLAGLTGGFVDSNGIFESIDETDKTKVYRGVWDRIVPGRSHRWSQSASSDGGKSWDVSWTMDWSRT